MLSSIFSDHSSDTTITQYATVAEADAYFAKKFQHVVWDDCDTDMKDRALWEASLRINQQRFQGVKTSESQPLEFPRDAATEIPNDIKAACCELAYSLADGVDPESEVSNVPQIAAGFFSVRATHDRKFVQEHLVAGIPSYTAWSMLKPYLVSFEGVKVERI